MTPETESPAQLAERLGLHFHDLGLLIRALTHRSYCNEHPEALEDNERLEFLGDAVLDFVVGDWVYHHFPEMHEGELTRLRSALVRNEQLARFAARLKLGAALRLGEGEEISGARQRSGLLGSAFEALIGALYLDAGLEAVQRFVHPLLEECAADVVATSLLDPKSRFQEWAQANKLGTPRYIVLAMHGPDHAPLFEVEVRIGDQVYGHGSGPSKQAATLAAARDALQRVEEG